MTLNTTNIDTKDHEAETSTTLLYPELSYKIQGAAIDVRKHYGPGHKEILYQKAFAEELDIRGVKYEREKSVQIYSVYTIKVLETFRPDFVVEDKVIVETKALAYIPSKLADQLYDYLRNSDYELGYFINFSGEKLFMKRIIYSNNRKFHFNIGGT